MNVHIVSIGVFKDLQSCVMHVQGVICTFDSLLINAFEVEEKLVRKHKENKALQ